MGFARFLLPFISPPLSQLTLAQFTQSLVSFSLARSHSHPRVLPAFLINRLPVLFPSSTSLSWFASFLPQSLTRFLPLPLSVASSFPLLLSHSHITSQISSLVHSLTHSIYFSFTLTLASLLLIHLFVLSFTHSFIVSALINSLNSTPAIPLAHA